MVLLLAGSSSFIRGAVAESAIEGKENWRHLSIDDLMIEDETEETDRRQHEEELVEVLANCVNEMKKDNLHLLLSMPLDDSLFSLIKLRLPQIISVLLGVPDEKTNAAFDNIIDSKKTSLIETQKIMGDMMKEGA